MKLRFQTNDNEIAFRKPVSSHVPILHSAEMAAQYRAARIGGDFFDFLRVEERCLFALLDIAGKREKALHIAAYVQEAFRIRGQELCEATANDADMLVELQLAINRSIMSACGGVCFAPAFLGCYNQSIGTLAYINAGHIPAIMKDADGTQLLEATGLPLGLFSHATTDARFLALSPGAALALVSKGLVESRNHSGDFGIQRVQDFMETNSFHSAEEICKKLLEAVCRFEEEAAPFGRGFIFPGWEQYEPNDTTALALMRLPEVASTPASGAIFN